MHFAKNQHLAAYWRQTKDGRLACLLCPQACLIEPGQSGRCLVRQNRQGQLFATAYGKVTALALDPIEKKPLHYFQPGSRILSLGSYGCNLQCQFCQNWSISQGEASFIELTPDQLVARALAARLNGNIGLAYTYNEPLINFEYIKDCALLARQAGLVNVLVSNGVINEEPLAELLPLIDAWNIDLKAWQPDYYSRICQGNLDWVKKTIQQVAPRSHLEVTCLLLPGLNDSFADIEQMAAWLAGQSADIVLHLTRHKPDYKMADPPPISRTRLEKLAAAAAVHLKHVLMGNV